MVGVTKIMRFFLLFADDWLWNNRPTNGKSPTIAKRVKEQINELVPDEIESVLQNMQIIRNGIKGDFAEKVKQLNELTQVLAAKQITLEEINKQKFRARAK